MGLAEGTPLADALEDLKQKAGNKLELVKEGTTPTLKASQAVPANVQSAIDSVNTYISTLNGTASALATVPDDARALVSQVTGLPEQLQSDYKSLNLSLKDLPATLTQVKTNVEVTKNLPDKAEKVVNQAKKNLTTITGAFGGDATSSSGSTDSTGGAMSAEKATTDSSGTTEAKTAAPKANKPMKLAKPAPKDDDDDDDDDD